MDSSSLKQYTLMHISMTKTEMLWGPFVTCSASVETSRSTGIGARIIMFFMTPRPVTSSCGLSQPIGLSSCSSCMKFDRVTSLASKDLAIRPPVKSYSALRVRYHTFWETTSLRSLVFALRSQVSQCPVAMPRSSYVNPKIVTASASAFAYKTIGGRQRRTEEATRRGEWDHGGLTRLEEAVHEAHITSVLA